jgi:hypothetical protein
VLTTARAPRADAHQSDCVASIAPRGVGMTPVDRRRAAWVSTLVVLYSRRPDLAGVHDPADIAVESVTSAV